MCSAEAAAATSWPSARFVPQCGRPEGVLRDGGAICRAFRRERRRLLGDLCRVDSSEATQARTQLNVSSFTRAPSPVARNGLAFIQTYATVTTPTDALRVREGMAVTQLFYRLESARVRLKEGSSGLPPIFTLSVGCTRPVSGEEGRPDRRAFEDTERSSSQPPDPARETRSRR